MAELDVQRKKSNPWWIWVLLAIVIAGILFYFLRDRTDNFQAAYSGHRTEVAQLA
jgi:triacylglycerol esterase/lipase EstA (alpha/beta hydrolase family)